MELKGMSNVQLEQQLGRLVNQHKVVVDVTLLNEGALVSIHQRLWPGATLMPVSLP
jgi:hypothetical protein